jgi:hypothetical protein
LLLGGNKHANAWKKITTFKESPKKPSNTLKSGNKYNLMEENQHHMPVAMAAAGLNEARECCEKGTEQASTMAFLQLYGHGGENWTQGGSPYSDRPLPHQPKSKTILSEPTTLCRLSDNAFILN